MTQNKDIKRRVRARMKKTGESYTAARAHLAKKSPSGKTPKTDYASLAGMSDAVIKDKTGCTWEKWVKSLDYYGADKMKHRDIAKLVSDKFKVGPWWTQSVTVGYERIKGLRARGQRRDGTYEASKSRTFNVPVKTLYEKWANASSRRNILGGREVKITTATSPKSIRMRWADGTIIAVGFYPKGDSKSSVAVQHTRLPDRDTATALKAYWSERLDALAEMLKP